MEFVKRLKLRETAQHALALYDVYVFLSRILPYKAFIHTKHVSILSSLLECLAPLVRTSGKLAAGWAAAKLLSLSPASVLAETAQASIVCAWLVRGLFGAHPPAASEGGHQTPKRGSVKKGRPGVWHFLVSSANAKYSSLYTVSLLSKRHGCSSGAKLSA